MSINLIPTKLIIPKRQPGVIRRPRLIDFLHEHLERKLLFVTAPAGYGKTTLLVDFAGDADLPVCWYTLDEGDCDPGTFLAHLVASIQKKFPQFGRQSSALIEHNVFGARAMTAALVADLIDAVPEYFVLILDDWHLVGDEPAIRELLDQLLRYLPEHAHLIIAGRALPRGPLVRLAARGDVAGLGPNDLRFTAAEVGQVLHDRFGLDLVTDQAEKLAAESEGWITAILLSSQPEWQSLLAGLPRATAGASGRLYDYLAGEVFDRLPQLLGRFLMESSIPRQFTAVWCDALRGQPDSDEWIDQVEAHNLFITRIEAEDDVWYRYHHLFREFLLARFKKDDVAGFARLQARSGALLESRRQIEEAVEHYLLSGSPERAVHLMNTSARSLYIAGRTQTLLRWAGALPDDQWTSAPELRLFQGQILADRNQPSDALPILEQAEAIFRTHADFIGQIRSILLQGWMLYAQGKLPDASVIGQAALGHFTEWHVADVTLEAQARRLIGVSLAGMGQWREGEQYLSQALSLYRCCDSDERRAFNLGRTLNDLALTLRSMGRLEEATALQAEALTLWREIGNPGPLALCLNNLGYDCFLMGDYDGAWKLYAEALAKAEESEDRNLHAMVTDGIAAVYRDRGEFERAIETYADVLAQARAVGNQPLVSWALDGLGHAYRLSGDLDRALGLFEQARHVADRGGLEPQVTLSTGSIGVVYLELNRVVDGLAELERAATRLREAGSDLDLGRILFWLAKGYYSSGQTALAKERLAEMMHIAKRLGYRPFSLAEGRREISFLAWAVDQFTGEPQLRRWLHDLQTAATVVPGETAAKPVMALRLEVRAFGTGRILCDNRLLTTSDWGGSAIGRELFFYLLEYSPQSRDEIGATFWPDLSVGRMTSSFHAAKYKARRALGVEFAIYDNEHYQIDPELGIRYDVIEFTRLWNSARRRRAADPQKLIEFQQAVDLYSGDFLEDVYSNWVIERRRVYQRQYLDALAYIVQELMRRDQFNQALDQAGTGLARDYYREDLHRTVISCLAHMGRQTEALVHFEDMARHFRLEIQAEPEPETARLVDRVRSHRLD